LSGIVASARRVARPFRPAHPKFVLRNVPGS